MRLRARWFEMRFIQVGLGPVGLNLVRCALGRGHKLVGAVDPHPEKVGRDVGTLSGGDPAGCVVVSQLEEVSEHADVALHATGSSLSVVAPQFLECAARGLNVVSTCEEAFYPWRRDALLASDLDAAALAAGVTIVGAGVNPGFGMDLLPVIASAPCWSIAAVEVSRVVDAGTRRGPLQRKVGAGLSGEEFEAGVGRGEIAHVGLGDSAWMISDSLALGGETLNETLVPLWAADESVAGLHQTATVTRGEDAVVRLDLKMYLGAPDPSDEIRILGEPPITLLVPGGIPGETATAGVVVNAAERLDGARPGLLSTPDLPALPASARSRHPLAISWR